MFKFMKSKKGFTLVELMIVVVIMAILVVVAVPIYNSVTDNAREKTCLDNQRQLISSVGNIFMMKGISGTGTMTVTCTAGDNPEMTIAGLNAFAGSAVTEAEIKGAFQTVPVCGDEANTLVATVSENTTGGTATVTTACKLPGGTVNSDHVLPAND